MNYQSFLSSILQSKYYTQCKYVPMLEEIGELSHTIQRNSGSKILSKKLSEGEIFLYCSNRHICGCLFSHKFKKVKVEKGVQKFQLIQSVEKHSNDCQDFRNGTKSQQKIDILQNQPKSCNLIHSIDLQSTETSINSPISKQSIINNVKSMSITQNIQKKLYTEDQFSLLKKELQLKSKGLLSKSTEFQNQSNSPLMKKIQFHCKFQSCCPYEAILTLSEFEPTRLFQNHAKTYSLRIVNSSHLPECILDEEIINYNQNTMKIDREIDLLTRIIQENSEDLKPKDILKKLADQLGEEEDFIYHGLEKKINKRAIKKYFDNCVAKVRSKIFPPTKNPKTTSSISYESASKKDEDYVCK